MKISILMPIYNCPPDLLSKAIQSVLKQSHTDWEIVIKDGDIKHQAWFSPEIRAILDANQDRIKYVVGQESADRQNGQNSYYEALNWCIQNSQGEILTVLAGDDERGGPFVLQDVNTEFESCGSSPFCLYGSCEWIDRQGQHLEHKTSKPIPVTFESLLTDYRFYTPAIFWNRAVHDKFGLFDSMKYRWCADQDFWLRCWRGIDSKFYPGVIGKYRVWEKSLSRDNCDVMGLEGQEIIRRHS